jgi:hypothetical protein
MTTRAVSGTPASDAAERLRYLDDTAALLWPGASRLRRRGPARSNELLIGPSARLPRTLLPAAYGRAAGAALVAQGTGSGFAGRLQRRALALAARAGLAPWLMPDRLQPDPRRPSIVDHLSGVLGHPVILSTPITGRRANRKPVLQLLDARGHTVAWAKIGVDALTGELVKHEASVLTSLAAADLALRMPDIVHFGTWRDQPLLVLSPLPTTEGHRVGGDALRTAMRSLAAVPMSPGPAVPGYVETLDARIDRLRDRVPPADAVALALLRDVLNDLRPSLADAVLPTATWHGDWTPWNCAQRDGEVLVWDWERCVGGVPLGFDAVHYRLQDALIGQHVPHRAAARNCIASAPAVLAPWSLPADSARLIAALYLSEIAVRYVRDGQRAVGGSGGQVETWIVPALREFAHSREIA